MSLAKPPEAQPTEYESGRVALGVLKAVVEVQSKDATKAKLGTGFLVSRTLGTGVMQFFLVTNKHMVSDWNFGDGSIASYCRSIEISFYCKATGPANPSFTLVPVRLTDGKGEPDPNKIAIHPEPLVDVAVVRLEGELRLPNIDLVSFDVSYFLSFEQCIKWAGVGDQVFALGYPSGVTSVTNSYPIAKAGYVASVPGKEFGIDIPSTRRDGESGTTRLQGKYLIVDGLIVPGNSGGPVVLPMETKVRVDPNGQFQHTTKPSQNLIVGVVSLGFPSSGLTVVVSSDYILETIARFPLQ